VKLIISAVAALLFLSAGVAQAADLTPDQSEQIKLKSGKWSEQDMKAEALMKKGKYQEAETIYKQKLDERQSFGGDLFPEYEHLGALYLKWGKKEEAEKTFKDMVANRESLDGPNELQVVYPLKEYADCLEKNGKKTEAKAIRAHAAAIQKDVDSFPKFGKITAAVGSPERIAEGEKVRAMGEKLVTSDLQNKALLYFQRAVELNANDAKAVCDRGEAENWLQQDAKALLDFNKAIKLKPDLAKAYRDRAFLYEGRNQYQQAIADFDKAIALNPKDFDTMGSRAKLLDEMGKHKEAVVGYTKIIETNPDLYWPYVQRAVAYAAMGNHKSAIADYTVVVDRAPTDGDYHEYRAAAYIKAGDFQNALDDYDKLIEINPKYSIGYQGRAKLYEKLDGKKTPRAIADYNMAKKLGYAN
jgi:tetratricopeptide (TPR) repeat protein